MDVLKHGKSVKLTQGRKKHLAECISTWVSLNHYINSLTANELAFCLYHESKTLKRPRVFRRLLGRWATVVKNDALKAVGIIP